MKASDFDKLAADIIALTGLDLRPCSNQKGRTLDYGYAHIFFPDSPADPFSVHFRKETSPSSDSGDPTTKTTASLLTAQARDELVAFCADVLRTGRTLACGKGIDVRSLLQYPQVQGCDYPMSDLKAFFERREGLDLDPDYQRGHVWTEKQQSLFVGHMLEGGAVPPLYVQRYESSKTGGKGWFDMPLEMVDGKQRYTAIQRWVAGEISAELADGTMVWYKDCNEVDRRCLPHVRVLFIDLTREDRLKFYLKLNRGGVVHSDSDIDKVRHLLAREEQQKAWDATTSQMLQAAGLTDPDGDLDLQKAADMAAALHSNNK